MDNDSSQFILLRVYVLNILTKMNAFNTKGF